MKKFPAVLAATVLGAAGFAAAGIASGGSLLHALTGTTESTPVVTTATTSTTSHEGEGHGRKVTLCHHTGSKKNPGHTISVSQNAVNAHLKHHDELGACPTVAAAGSKSHGKSDDHGKDKHGTTTPATTTTSTTSDDDASKGHGHDNGKGHGKP